MPRVTVNVLYDCEASTGCTSATLERSLPVSYQATPDRFGFRPLTLNGRSTFTRYQGRLALSQDRSVVQLTGYDWAPEGSDLDTFPQKREGATWSLFLDGRQNITTFCKSQNTGSYTASGAYY